MESTKYERALIVGAGPGLSASLARLFAREGMKVALAARNTDKLAALCKETGAKAFFPTAIQELGGVYDMIAHELANQYLVGYQPTNTLRNDAWREIKVEVDGYTNVRARLGYRAVPMK